MSKHNTPLDRENIPAGRNDTRISARRLEEISHGLSERDFAILQDIRLFRYVTTTQLCRLHFTKVSVADTADKITPRAALRACNRELAKLRELKLISSLQRRIGGVRAGSGAYVWTLDAGGARLLIKSNEQAPRKRFYEPSVAFLEHTLAVTETAIRLKELQATHCEIEPKCWRIFAGLGGTPQRLRPDLFAVTASGDYDDHWFIEVDLATESPAIVLRKCEQYLAYRRSGSEQRAYGVFPVVVWLVPTDRRKEALKRHIADELQNNSNIFVVITMDELDGLVKEGLAMHKEDKL
jgi:hypothetical protein